MSKILINNDGHLTDEAVKGIKEGSLNDDENMIVLNHICDCIECASLLSESYDEKELETVSCDFEERVSKKIKEHEKYKFKFGFYCIKVIAAASIAICMIFSNQFNFIMNSGSNIKAPDYKKANAVCLRLNDFSQKVINLEVHR